MRDIVVGSSIVFAALGIVTWLTLWSRKTIDFIADKKVHTAREIEKALHDE
mgnify:CR=1 FL=1|jgi:hypothetical protein